MVDRGAIDLFICGSMDLCNRGFVILKLVTLILILFIVKLLCVCGYHFLADFCNRQIYR